MPYSSVADVPDYVPKDKRKQWLEVFNSAYAAAKKDGKSNEEAEQSAFAQANGVAGPNTSKVAWPQGLVKIGTPATGFVRGIHGPFNCGHCDHLSDDGYFCQHTEVIADPDVPHDDQGRVPVAKADCCNEYDPILGTETVATQEKLRLRMSKFKKFIPFVKIDEAKRQVFGIVTAEVPDKDDEVCDYEKSKPYYKAVIDEFSKATDGANFFPLREMHQLTAAGKCISFEFRDPEKEIYMGFEVVDDDAWKKVQKRVYTGFSQGGAMVGDLTPDPKFKGCMRYVADPSEISLVDNPCLGVAHFAMVKADGTVEIRKHKSVPAKLKKANENGCDCECENCISNGCENCTNVDCDDPDCMNCPMQARFGTAKKAEKMKKREVLLKQSFRKAARIWVNKNAGKLGKKQIHPVAKTLSGPIPIERMRSLIKISKPLISSEIVKVGRQATFMKIDDDLGRRLQKGMCEVSCLADVIDHLCYIFHMVVNEQMWEDDKESQVPAALQKNIEELVATFLEYVTEETDELKEEIAVRLAGEQAAIAVG